MLSDRDAILAAIRANPDEDTPRLMFADWLDEHGESERAEFIRLQCERAQLADEGNASYAMYAFLRDRYPIGLAATDWTRIDLGVQRLVALSMRADDLLKRHGEAWVPKLPKNSKVRWDGFHRGFPHRVALDGVRNLKAVAKSIRAAVPAVTLVADSFTPRFAERLRAAGLLEWIRGLELQNDSHSGLREFGNRSEAARLGTLRLRYAENGIGFALGSPNWSGLRELGPSSGYTPASEAETLFVTPHLRTLNRLHLSGADDWTADTVRLLAVGGFTELTSLHLTRCGLDDDAAEALANCPHLATLRTLDLTGNRIDGRGATALLTSPHLAGLAYLGLDANPCTGLDAKRLATAGPGALRMLHFHGSRLRTADVRALTRCPRLRTLWYLDLDDNLLTTAAVRELVRGFGKWCPPILWLTYNRIDDRGAELLAKWKAAAGLSALHLKYNHTMTDDGVRALLDSPHLTNLDSLGVSIQSDAVDARLRARFRHHDVQY